MRSGTHRDIQFCTKRRCFAVKIHRWGRGPIENGNSDAKHAVVHSESDRSCLVPLETGYSGPKVTVLHTKSTGGVLDPQRLLILVLKSRFCLNKTTDEGWNPYGLDIFVLSTLLCVLKTTDEGWDPCYSGANHAVLHEQNDRWCLGPIEICYLSPKPLFCMKKPQMRAGTHRD